MMKKLLILAGLISALATPAIASANAGNAPAKPVRSQVVSYADIDLASRKGVDELKRRVRVAVNNVCGEASPWDLAGQNRAKRCIRENKRRTSAEASAAIARADPSIRIANKQ